MCTDEDFEPLQRHSYSPIRDWWHRVYIEIWGPAICHACPTVSITPKDLTRFQIVLRNPSVKLEIQCAFIHLPINCICNISCDNSLQFLTDAVQIVGVFPKLIQCTMPILSSIPSPCIIPCGLRYCHSHYHPVAFQGRCARVFPICNNRKLTDPHFQQKMWPISIHPCQYI